MRQYVEAMELNIEFPENPDFIRADITGKTDSEIAVITEVVREVMAGKIYRLTTHDCGHDESKACVVVEI